MTKTFTNEASAFCCYSYYDRRKMQLTQVANRQMYHLDMGTLKVYELRAEPDLFSKKALAITEEAEVHFQYARNLGQYMVQLKNEIHEMEKGIAL